MLPFIVELVFISIAGLIVYIFKSQEVEHQLIPFFYALAIFVSLLYPMAVAVFFYLELVEEKQMRDGQVQ